MSTPQTDRGWARALAAVHPDIGGDPETFIRLQDRREQWRKRRRTCWQCGQPCQSVSVYARTSSRFCGTVCAARFVAASRRQPARLKRGQQ